MVLITSARRGVQALRDGSLTVGEMPQAVHLHAEDPAVDLMKKIIFGVEIVVHGPFCHARGRYDFLDGRALEALVGEQTRRRRQQPLAYRFLDGRAQPRHTDLL